MGSAAAQEKAEIAEEEQVLSETIIAERELSQIIALLNKVEYRNIHEDTAWTISNFNGALKKLLDLIRLEKNVITKSKDVEAKMEHFRQSKMLTGDEWKTITMLSRFDKILRGHLSILESMKLQLMEIEKTKNSEKVKAFYKRLNAEKNALYGVSRQLTEIVELEERLVEIISADLKRTDLMTKGEIGVRQETEAILKEYFSLTRIIDFEHGGINWWQIDPISGQKKIQAVEQGLMDMFKRLKNLVTHSAQIQLSLKKFRETDLLTSEEARVLGFGKEIEKEITAQFEELKLLRRELVNPKVERKQFIALLENFNFRANHTVNEIKRMLAMESDITTKLGI